MKKLLRVSLVSIIIMLQLAAGVIFTVKKAYADPVIDQSAGSWSDTFLDSNSNSVQDGISSSTGVEAVYGDLKLKNIPWYDFNWNYRSSITITNASSGSLANYQELLTIDTAALVGAGKMLANGNDIRFTNFTSSAVYDYWIESGINTAATKIWVKVPSLPIGDTILQMYYGNIGAAAASSFTNTMENPPVTWWSKTYNSGFNDKANGIAVDSGKDVIVAGYKTNADATTDIFVTKYDTNGNVAAGWPKTYDGGIAADDVATGVAVDSSDNIIVAGRSSNGTNSDFIVIKYNPDGTPFWSGLEGNGGIAKIYDGGDIDSANGVAVDSGDNSIIVTGDTTVPATFNTNFLTIKYNSSGTLVWSKTYDNSSVTDSWDKPNAVTTDSGNNIIVAGYSQNNDITYENDFYTIKYNSAGTVVWEKRYANGFYNEANGVAVDSLGNAISAGRTNDGANDDFRIIKYSAADGTEIWNKTYGTGAGVNDIANGVAVDRNNSIIIAGQIGGDSGWNYGILKYDSAGNEIWNQYYDSGNTPDSAQGIAIDNGNDILVTGYAQNTDSDFYTIKYSEHKYADAVPAYSIGAELDKTNSGTITSVDIIPTAIYGWTEFNWTDSIPVGTDIIYTLEAWNGSSWVTPTLTDASANANGSFTSSPVDLSGLDFNIYTKIKLTADFSSTVVAETPLLSQWSVLWNAASPAKAITAFSFTNPAAIGVIDEGAKTIAATVPFGTDVGALVAAFTTTGSSVAVGTTPQASGVTPNNFTAPVIYTVTAEDLTIQTYAVTVTVAANSAKNITSFNFTSPAAIGTVDNTAHTVALIVPYGTGVTALMPTIAVSTNATISPLAGVAQNFTAPVAYTVTAEDLTAQTYIVTVTVAAADLPLAPSGLSATTASSSSINLSWTDNSSNETGFKIYRNGSLIATTSANVIFYSSTGLSSGTSYSYYVTAANADGDSSASNTATAATSSSGGGGGGGGGGYTPASSVTNMSISINSGAASTNNSAVTLTIGAANAAKMAISNNADFSGGAWETFAVSKAWNLTSGDGVKTVYIKFMDASGYSSAAISDTINFSASASTYPDGTIVKSSVAPEVYVIKNGQKEWTKTAEEFTAGGYKWENLKIISSEELAAIPNYGASVSNPSPISGNGFADGTLIKTSDSFRVYVIISQKKKWISTPEVFETMGYKWGSVGIVSKADLDKIPDYEDNLIRTIGDYKVYLVVNGIKRHIPNPEIFLNYGFSWDDIKDVSASTVAQYKQAYLVRVSKQGTIYYLSPQGVKKWIRTPEIFASYNDKWEDIQVISKKERDSYPESNLIRLSGDSKIYLIENNIKRWIPTTAIFNAHHYDYDLVLTVNKFEFDYYRTGSNVK